MSPGQDSGYNEITIISGCPELRLPRDFRKIMTRNLLLAVLLLPSLLLARSAVASYTLFESGHSRPLALSADGERLFAVNTPDNSLEIFFITTAGLLHSASVPVGLEPIAVAPRNNSEVWVVNHLSDSVSIVDVAASPPRVVRTLLVGDEPGDIVFAGPSGDRAFITAAHRGQNSPYTSATNPGEFTTPGIGRADVWVFNVASLGDALGGSPLTIVTLLGDTPRALEVSPDGATVYAAVFKSGNRTTTIAEGAVCDMHTTGSCTINGSVAPGALPPPVNVTKDDLPQPETGLIVKFDGTHWKDELDRNWDSMVRFSLPDRDVFAIDATADPPVESASYSGVGTVNFSMAVNPVTGRLYVANTEAINEIRFEGERAPGSTVSSVRGHLHETRVTIIDPAAPSVIPRHLNKHIDYDLDSPPPGIKEKSLAIPQGIAVSANGALLYLAAKGSSKVGVFSTSQLESDPPWQYCHSCISQPRLPSCHPIAALGGSPCPLRHTG